ncbi:cupin domain-containing protein [Tabrizicola sp. SY72]|nr:cupin domain-containing protein [Tabrizicola sp. SY72]
MDIFRAGHIPSRAGPADWFTGRVRIDALFNPAAPDRVQGASVTFEPGARTAWHTHPLGQTLIVTAGLGRVQRLGGPVEEIRPGDVICFAPGEKHWHPRQSSFAVVSMCPAITARCFVRRCGWHAGRTFPSSASGHRPGRWPNLVCCPMGRGRFTGHRWRRSASAT